MRKRPGAILGEAIRNLRTRPATTEYPHKSLEIADMYRGKLVFAAENCIGCNMCVRDCPSKAIQIQKTMVEEKQCFKAFLRLDKCIFCGQCVDSCRRNALSMSNKIELAAFDRESLFQEI